MKETSGKDSNSAIDSIGVIKRLRAQLPIVAVELINANLDMTDAANQSFAAAPDSPLEHTPRWHQHGIITHSIKFCEDLQLLVPEHLSQWGLAEPADAVLSTEVDGLTKGRLLQITALVHDIGKFTARKIKRDDSGAISATFGHHEEHSGKIVRERLYKTFEGWGLTDNHIAYIARSAELHFELGKARQASKSATGYSMDFAGSPIFSAVARNIIETHPEFALEIGIQFIADSSSKTEVAATADTDDGIAAQRPELEQTIAAKGLHPALINQALQQPVNLEVARRFLEIWATSPAGL